MFKIERLNFSFNKSLDFILITERQTMLISGETARYELTHLNQNCLQKNTILPLALKELKWSATYLSYVGKG